MMHETEDELRRRRMGGGVRGPSRKSPRPKPGRGRPRPFGRPGAPPGVVPWPVPTYPDVASEPAGNASGVGPASERVRWLQDCLNRTLSAGLLVTGVLDVATRSAVRSFQAREGLPATGLFGPGTEEALRRTCVAAASGEGELFESEASGSDGRIIDLTASASKEKRKGVRDPKKVYALVLHQMACCVQRKDPLKSYLNVGAHFAILTDGRILQLHPISALLWASNGFNPRSVAVEFAGNFPDVRGKWWKGDVYGKNRPTAAQIEAGRYLIRHLIRTMGLTHVLAHRQSSATRENDPGPEIWFNVGQWAVDNLGMKDGGPGFKIHDGNPIPDAWRKWGRTSPTPELFSEANQEEVMHSFNCGCRRCHAGQREVFEGEGFEIGDSGELDEMSGQLGEVDEMDLALELLSISNEEEWEQFLGKLWKGVKSAGRVLKPLGGVLKQAAKAALPMVGGALGSFIPIPGVGTAVGRALGTAVSNALEVQDGELAHEDSELDLARRFVRVAAAAGRNAAAAPANADPAATVTNALRSAVQTQLPQANLRGNAGRAGRWERRGRSIVVLGA